MNNNRSRTQNEIAQAVNQLKDAGINTPRRDINWLISAFFNIGMARAICSDFELNDTQWDYFRQLIQQRASRVPLQHIIGYCHFWKFKICVTPDVLIPRPETEHVVETALENIGPNFSGTAVDCCTGSGCIALAVASECSGARVLGVDKSIKAIDIARQNRDRLAITNCDFIAGDMLQSFPDRSVDLITANPPYISRDDHASLQMEVLHEPRQALLSGPDGLDHIRLLLVQSQRILKKNGLLVFEFGYNQGDQIRILAKKLASRQFVRFEVKEDLAGNERVGLLKYV